MEETQVKLASWLQRAERSSLQNYENELLESVQFSVEREAALAEATREVRAFEELCFESPEQISAEQFGSDFDRMRNLEGVARIGIRAGRVVIATHRLFQTYPPPSEAGFSRVEPSEYNVGSIEFSIDPKGESYSAIYFQTLKQGEYRNRFFVGSNICFGSNVLDGGMNQTIAKLLVKYKVADVVALVLTFFRFVNRHPMSTHDDDRGIFVAAYEPLCGTRKFTESDWAWERKAYVALMHETMEARAAARRTKELNRLADVREFAFREAQTCWRDAAELEQLYRHTRERVAAVPVKAERVLRALEKHPAVIGVDVQNGLRIWFEQPAVFKYPLALLVQEDGTLRLISFQQYWGHTETHSILWGYTDDRNVLELVVRGEYAKVLSLVMDVTAAALGWIRTDEF